MRFRFVDRILDWTPHRRICGIKTVSFEEYSLKEAFGDEGRLPETLLLESLLQLGNWLILLSSDFRQMGMITKLGQISFFDSLRLGQRLDMEVTLQQQNEEGFLLSGEGRVSGRTIIRGTGCIATPAPADKYVNPEDMRVLLSEILQGC